jgi:hypothetical protein
MNITFDEYAEENQVVYKAVQQFIDGVDCLEKKKDGQIYIHQDGVKKSYYIRCCISGDTVANKIDLNARLDPQSTDTFRDNRELLLSHNTFRRMSHDAENEREFSDIIAEYNIDYSPEKPLKIWGGQHRSRAIQDAYKKKGVMRYHGFRIYFCLTKEQRSELALVSNTNIAVSNDLFDRQLEETMIGPHLREWCVKVGLLDANEDFPDVGSKSEKITTQAARSFIVNFFKGKERGEQIASDKLDYNVYEPYLCKTGVVLDDEYQKLIDEKDGTLWTDEALIKAGQAFSALHDKQYEAIKQSKHNIKGFRAKTLTSAILSSWSFVSGLLQSHPVRLKNHLSIPPSARGVPDPLNTDEMSKFHHDQDPPTYRGIGTRSDIKERQRIAQIFLARSLNEGTPIDKSLINKAVSTVIGLKAMSKGYTN